MASFAAIVTDAKKACGAAVVGAASALAAGLIDNATAALITGIAAVVSTVAVYLLGNRAPAQDAPPRPPTPR